MAVESRDRDIVDVLIAKHHHHPYRREERRFREVECDGPPCAHLFTPVNDWFVPVSLDKELTIYFRTVSTPSVGSGNDYNVAVFSPIPPPHTRNLQEVFRPYQAAVLYTAYDMEVIPGISTQFVERFELLALHRQTGHEIFFMPTGWIETSLGPVVALHESAQAMPKSSQAQRSA